MRYHKEGFPEEDELVTCTVTSVQYNSVFVKLDDYGKSGLIHISEVSPGRIRNLRDYVKEGKVVVCKVLRVNEQRGHIDVSLRRVNEAQRRMKVEERKAEQKAEKIAETLAAQLGEDPQAVYDAVAGALFPQYGMLNYAFTDVVENDASLEKAGLDKKYAKPLQALVIDRIKPKEVLIEGDLSLSTYAIDGVDAVKDLLVKLSKTSDQLDLRYLGGGSWRVAVVAPEFKEAEGILKQALAQTEIVAGKRGIKTDFRRKE
ncbi:S1 RNA-binding domain-containing protein [Candidatus Woesearchaeota archaeon]|nr:S1 RNA-binding domain-containing protein [Candidatus Woesearchaeota archaeon]